MIHPHSELALRLHSAPAALGLQTAPEGVAVDRRRAAL